MNDLLDDLQIIKAGDPLYQQMENVKTEKILKKAKNVQQLQNDLSTPEAWLKDVSLTLQRTIPNLKRLVGDSDDPELIAQIQELEKKQDLLRTAFPSATFAGELILPSATMVAGLPLRTAGAVIAGVGEAAGLSTSEQDPKFNAGVAGLSPVALNMAGKTIGGVIEAIGVGTEKSKNAFTSTDEQQAGNAILRYLNEMDLTLDEVLEARQKLGDNATLADVKNMRGLSQGVGVRSPANKYRDVLEVRSMGKSERLLSDLQEITDISPDVFNNTIKKVIQKRQEVSTPLYNEAFNLELDMPDATLNGLINRLKSSGAWSQVKKNAGIQGIDLEDTIGYRQLHEAKMALDDVIEKEVKTGRRYRASKLMDLKQDLLSAIEKNNSTYKQARLMFAGVSEIKTAGEVGAKLFDNPKLLNKKLTNEDLQEYIADMSATEYDVFRQGAIKSLTDYIDKMPINVDVSRKLLMRKPVMEKVAMLFKEPEQYQHFLKSLNRESIFQQSYNDIFGNSQTANRLLGEALLKNEGKGFIEVAKNIVSGSLSDKAMQQLTDIMFNKDISNDYVRGVLTKAGLLNTYTGNNAIEKLRNKWDKIFNFYHKNVSASTVALGSASMTTAPVGSQEYNNE